MLLHFTTIQLESPPPQEVLDQRCSWYVLIGLLGLTLGVRVVGMDLAGALLTGLMLGFAVVIVRDGMSELQRYNLPFGLLCSLNFFFDILPLLSMLSGRRREEIRPISTKYTQEQRYSVTVKTYPFFDMSQGIVYNAESLSMVLSPLCMLMGAYLSFRAHDAIMRHAPPIFEDDLLQAGMGMGRQNLGGGGAEADARRALQNPGGPNANRWSMTQSGGYGSQRNFEAFSGEGHRLDPN